MIAALLARLGLSVVIPWWLGYALSAAVGVFAIWWVYSTGLEAGRAECAAAALKEQQRQGSIASEESAKADRLATTIINKDQKRDAELSQLDREAADAVDADTVCLPADSVRRIDGIR